jgi:hypothetical protein
MKAQASLAGVLDGIADSVDILTVLWLYFTQPLLTSWAWS